MCCASGELSCLGFISACTLEESGLAIVSCQSCSILKVAWVAVRLCESKGEDRGNGQTEGTYPSEEGGGRLFLSDRGHKLRLRRHNRKPWMARDERKTLETMGDRDMIVVFLMNPLL